MVIVMEKYKKKSKNGFQMIYNNNHFENNMGLDMDLYYIIIT